LRVLEGNVTKREGRGKKGQCAGRGKAQKKGLKHMQRTFIKSAEMNHPREGSDSQAEQGE